QHHIARARIRQGRGDVDGAFADTERAVEVGRIAGDPQAIMPALAERARVLFVAGKVDEAGSTVDEMLALVDPRPMMDWAWWFLTAAIILTDLGRGQELLDLGGE